MKLFAYAYVNFFDNDPQLKTVLAEDVMDALHAIFCQCCPVTDGFDSNDAAEAWNMLETPEDVVQYLLNGEIGITVPVALEDLSDISIVAPINQPEDVEKPTSLFDIEPQPAQANHNVPEAVSFKDTQLTCSQIVYDLYYTGPVDYLQRFANARIAIAIHMLKAHKFAHELQPTQIELYKATECIQDRSAFSLHESDFKHLSDLIDVGSDVYVNQEDRLNFDAIVRDYAQSGYQSVNTLLWRVWTWFPECPARVAAAAFCILLACPVFYLHLRNNDYDAAIEAFKSICKSIDVPLGA